MQTSVATVILAGGQSTRMGRDKAALRLENQTLLERTARLASAVSAPVAVVGRARPDDWPQELKAQFVPDGAENAGPLGGLVGALRWAQSVECEAVLLLPCDLPQLNAEVLRWIVAQPRENGSLAVTRDGQIEPLFAIYSLQVLAEAQTRLQSGRRSLHGLIEMRRERNEFALLELPIEWHGALFNCNTPEDWQRARRE